MKTITKIAALATALACATVISATAAPNIYGTGGLMEVPDDTIYAVGTLAPAFHTVVNSSDSDDSLNFFTVGTGILPNLSISGGLKSDGSTDAILNGKYRFLAETTTQPSVTAGAIDLFSNVSSDATLYVEVGKNLTAAAEEVAGGASKPLRGYIGVGTGLLNGVFAGLDWTLAPKLSAMLEYIGSDKGLTGNSHFNGGLRLAVTNNLRVDLGAIDFQDFTAGASYNFLRF